MLRSLARSTGREDLLRTEVLGGKPERLALLGATDEKNSGLPAGVTLYLKGAGLEKGDWHNSGPACGMAQLLADIR